MNQQNFLNTLKRQLHFNQGKFFLILVQCNSKNERDKSIEKLKNECKLKLEILVLKESTKSLYQAIKQFLEQNSFDALMVCDLESIEDIDSLLLATNNIREEFRKFKFPLVLWVTDELMRKLIRLVPDFYSWAITIQFKKENEDNDLIKSIRDKIKKIFSQMDNASENIFFDCKSTENQEEIQSESKWDEELTEDLEYIQSLIKEIQNSQEPKPIEDIEEIEINLQFCLALIAYNFIGKDKDKHRSHYKECFNQIEQKGKIRNPMWIHCYLGLWLLEDAIRNPIKNNQAAQNAKDQFGKVMPKLDNNDKLVAKFINFQAESIYLTLDWQKQNISEDLQNLEGIIKRAKTLHQEDKFKKAQVLSLSAEFNRKQEQKQKQKQAEKEAKQALKLLENLKETRELENFSSYFYKTRCLFVLGDVERNFGRIEDSIQTLEKAKDKDKDKVGLIKNNAPKLYIDILESLRQSYYKDGKYLEAFQNKLKKQETENQFGFLFFIGASRLKANQESENVAQEITDSGRQDTVNKIVERIDTIKRLTILYGQSGVGKSSLIEAGLVPTLKNTKLPRKRTIVLRDYSDWTKNKKLIEKLELNDDYTTSSNTEEERIKRVLEKIKELTKDCIVVLIFDQLEEFFVNHEKLNQREIFYNFLRQCLDHSEIVNLRVILSLREDYLYLMLEFHRYLEKFKQENKITKSVSDYVSDKENYFYLDDFSTEQAKTLIKALGKKNQQLALEDPLIDKLVEDLAEDTGKVRLVELQIVGAQLQNQGTPINKLEDYQKLGEINDNSQPPKLILVEQYIQEVIKDCGEKNKQIAELILYLLTNDKYTRPIKTNAQLQKEVETFLRKSDKQDIVKKLILPIFVQSNLVMLLSEKIDAEQSQIEKNNNANDKYQLVHDYLVAFIRQKENPDQKLKELEAEKNKQEKQLKWLKFGIFTVIPLIFVIVVFFRQREEENKVSKLKQLNIVFQSFIQRDNYQLDALLTSIRATDLVKHQSSEEKQAIINLWYALNLTQERNRIEYSSGAIVNISVSPDGKLMAFAGADGKIQLWEGDKKSQQLENGHEGTVWGVNFSPDGKLMASAGADGKIQLWKRDEQSKYIYDKTIGQHKKVARSVSFSPKGDFLASASDDGMIKLWKRNGNLNTEFKLFNTLTEHNEEVYSVAFSPDGNLIASAGADQNVRLWKWNGKSYIQDKILKRHKQAVWSVAFSPDSKLIASASDDKTVRLWKQDGTQIKVLEGHEVEVNSVTFTPDGEQIASADKKGNIILWNYKSGTRKIFPAHSLAINQISFIPREKEDKKLVLVSASLDGTVKFWKLDGIMPDVFQLPVDNSGIRISLNPQSTAFSPDGKLIATASDDKNVKLWTLIGKEWKLFQPPLHHTDQVNSVQFSANGRLIVSTSNDNKVNLWQLDDSSQKFNLKKSLTEKYNINSIAISPDGQQIAAASDDTTVKLWTLTGKEWKSQPPLHHTDQVNSVQLSANGRLIVSISNDNKVNLWQLDDSSQKFNLKTNLNKEQVLQSVSVNSDQENNWIIAAGTLGGDLKLWKSGSNSQGIKIESPQGQRHNLSVGNINFSPKGKVLASASRDGTVKLWSPEGIFFGTLQKGDSAVYSVTFNSGSSLVSRDEHNLIRMWNVNFEQELDKINDDEIDQQYITKLLKQACDQLDYYLSNPDTKSDTKSEANSEVQKICSRQTSK